MKPVSLSDLNLITASENTFEFEYITSEGKSTGVMISVIGSQAPKVQEFVRKFFNHRRTAEALAQKRGKELHRTIEDDEDFGIDYAAMRIVGWKGISEPFSEENAQILCRNNKEIREQVIEHSDNLGNFIKR